MAATKNFSKKVGWGEAVHLEIHFNSPGLKRIVEDAIHKAVGEDIGSRNTFKKLEAFAEPPTEWVWQWRAWLLLTALGQEPATWRIPDTVVPPAFDAERLRDLVRSWSPWIPILPGQQALDLIAA